MSKFTYEQVAELGNQEPIQIWEDTRVIYKNTLAFGDYMRDRFVDLRVATNNLILESASTNDMTKQLFDNLDGKCNNGPSLELMNCLPLKVPCDAEGTLCIDKFFQSEDEAKTEYTKVDYRKLLIEKRV